MKKLLHSLLFSVLVITGCVKISVDECPHFEEYARCDKTPITMSVVDNNTKAASVTSFSDGDKVGVYAYQDNVLQFSDELTKSGINWPAANHYYWENYDAEFGGEKTLTFRFVYPNQTVTNSSFTYQINSDPASQTDLLVKSVTRQADETNTPVAAQMDHALSMLDFLIKAEESGYQYTVTKITVSNPDKFYDKGTYSFDTGWSLLEKNPGIDEFDTPITTAEISSSTYTDVNAGNYALLIPQTVAQLNIEVAYSVVKNSKTLSSTCNASISNESYSPGNKYTYRMTLPTIEDVKPIKKVYIKDDYLWDDNTIKIGKKDRYQLHAYVVYNDNTEEEITTSDNSTWSISMDGQACTLVDGYKGLLEGKTGTLKHSTVMITYVSGSDTYTATIEVWTILL